MTELVRVNPVNPEIEKITRAAEVIASGGIVAFPTETVYGIGADAYNDEACKRIFKAKGRPPDNPLIVHISKMAQLDDVAVDVNNGLAEKMRVFWPGPVSFVLKANGNVSFTARAGLGTVAVRMPAHPVALRLIDQCKVPIAAPSANISGKPSGTTAKHVVEDLDGKVDMILDGGDAAFGLESTVLDATKEPYTLLRPGAFTLEELQEYLGNIEIPESIMRELDISEPVISPGMRHRHYSPRTRIIAVKGRELLLETIKESQGKGIAVLCSNEFASEIAGNQIRVIRLGAERNLYEIAKNLFESFRKLDGMAVKVALVQDFPERGIGLAIMNRIIRASGSDQVSSIEKMRERLINPENTT